MLQINAGSRIYFPGTQNNGCHQKHQVSYSRYTQALGSIFQVYKNTGCHQKHQVSCTRYTQDSGLSIPDMQKYCVMPNKHMYTERHVQDTHTMCHTSNLLTQCCMPHRIKHQVLYPRYTYPVPCPTQNKTPGAIPQIYLPCAVSHTDSNTRCYSPHILKQCCVMSNTHMYTERHVQDTHTMCHTSHILTQCCMPHRRKH